MGRFMESKKKEWARVAERLGDTVICKRCDATWHTYTDQCTADLDDACPGFLAIEEARKS